MAKVSLVTTSPFGLVARDANEPDLFDLPAPERSASPERPLRGRNREVWARTTTAEVTIIDTGVLHEAVARIEDDAVTIDQHPVNLQGPGQRVGINDKTAGQLSDLRLLDLCACRDSNPKPSDP